MVSDEKKHSGAEFGKARSRVTAYDWVLVAFFVVLITLCFLPLVNLLARSLSSADALAAREVGLLPVGLTLQAYELIFNDTTYTWSLAYTAMLTVTVTVVSLTLTVLCAFPLIFDDMKGKRVFSILMILTIYFHAGTIPNFILMRDLGLLDNPLVLVLPNAISVFNVIVMRSFFFGIPISLKESAEVEGANPFQVLWKIYLPLSTPVLATISLFYAVGRWNGFTDALLYITEARWQPIQLKLFNIINNMANIDTSGVDGVASMTGMSESLTAATVMFATVPILLVYPWLQRYFISGVTLGAVKE